MLRRAIEGAGIAYRIWEQPDLLTVYQECYPHVLEEDNPKQFTPSDRYRTEFSSTKLFARDGNTWSVLKTFFDLASACASHAGIGALKGQKWKDGNLSLPQRETSRIEVARAWHAVLNAYWNILKVFFAILKECIADGMKPAVEADMKQWHDDFPKMLKDRTFWIPELQSP